MIDTILQGDVRDCLRRLEDQSAQCCVTSPPYWGLRDYGVEGQIGLEPTPEAYVADLLDVFREVKRVLRDDGTLWLNLGDSYCGSWGNYGGQNRGVGRQRQIVNGSQVPNPAYEGHEDWRPPTTDVPGLKSKNLVGIPWRVAFALQADGWYLRSDIIWNKPNPMPESVTDRCTKSHEYIFMLTKSERYYYDAEAIKESGTSDVRERTRKVGEGQDTSIGTKGCAGFDGFRNKRDVWTVATEPCSEAHFAVFPSKLIEPMILAGTKTGDTILDPFMGSGTTAIQAVRFHRHYLGCELNPTYVKMAERRIAAMRGPLFEKEAA